MSDSKKPVQVPKDVLEGLEALRRHHGTDLLDIATITLGERAPGGWIRSRRGGRIPASHFPAGVPSRMSMSIGYKSKLHQAYLGLSA